MPDGLAMSRPILEIEKDVSAWIFAYIHYMSKHPSFVPWYIVMCQKLRPGQPGDNSCWSLFRRTPSVAPWGTKEMQSTWRQRQASTLLGESRAGARISRQVLFEMSSKCVCSHHLIWIDGLFLTFLARNFGCVSSHVTFSSKTWIFCEKIADGCWWAQKLCQEGETFPILLTKEVMQVGCWGLKEKIWIFNDLFSEFIVINPKRYAEVANSKTNVNDFSCLSFLVESKHWGFGVSPTWSLEWDLDTSDVAFWWSLLSPPFSDTTINSGWWFGTFFIFPYIGNNHPSWLIFFRGVQTTSQSWIIMIQQTVMIHYDFCDDMWPCDFTWDYVSVNNCDDTWLYVIHTSTYIEWIDD